MSTLATRMDKNIKQHYQLRELTISAFNTLTPEYLLETYTSQCTVVMNYMQCSFVPSPYFHFFPEQKWEWN